MGDIYTKLVSTVLFPLHEKLKRHDTVHVRSHMEESQWLPVEQIRQLQLQRLRQLLMRAGDQVPYYQELFRKIGFDPGELSSLSDLQKLPFLTKATIRENLERLKAKGAVDLARFNTGGSSGEPLIFFIGNERVSHDVAAKWRATRWWGVDIGDPEIVVWGSPIELGRQDRIKAVRDKLLRTTLLPAFEMSADNLDRFVARIRHIRPRMLFGYPSSLSLIARHAEEKGVAMNDLGIKVAFVTSERLYPHQREIIERVFACKVANGYGGRDAGFIAHECPAGGMHITAEDIVIEIIDTDGNVLPSGQSGEIVVTHLATSQFPFIRYRTGDVGVLGEGACSCGRGLPLLHEVQGRTTDFVVAEDGTVMHGLSLIYVLRDIPGIAEFRIVQETLELTRVELVKGAGFDEACFEEIKRGLRRRLGASVNIDIVVKDRIMPEKSGKYRYIISHVKP